MTVKPRWTKENIRKIYEMPFLDLVYNAATVHRKHHKPNEIKICSLISIKTGGCPEDCKYCPQSSRYQTDVNPEPMMNEEDAIEMAKKAIEKGASRICIGAAWRSPREGEQFEKILRVVKQISEMGVEVCCALGMLTDSQAARLREAGLYAYNHNLDSSPEFYRQIIITRTYEDRLKTLDTVERAGISLCCGGILGMGESVEDRIGLLYQLANRTPELGSFTINNLIPTKGTPLENHKPISSWEMVRFVATGRILMPKAMVRLSAGRLERSRLEQALCFFVGANSIHSGEKLLTRLNHDFPDDQAFFSLLNLIPSAPFGQAPNFTANSDRITCKQVDFTEELAQLLPGSANDD